MASRALADLLPVLRVVETDVSRIVPNEVASVAELMAAASSVLEQCEGAVVCELVALQLDDSSRLVLRRDREHTLPKGARCVLHAVAAARNDRNVVTTAHSSVAGTVGEEADDWEHMVHPASAPHLLLRDEFVLSPRVAALQEVAHALRSCQVEGLFEIHVTVAGEDAQEFQRACVELGKLKVIQIELSARASQNKRLRDQLMTASYHKCASIWEAQKIAFRFATVFATRGFAIERVKIEAMLHSEGVPNRPEDCPDSCYFEFHAKLLLDESQLDPLHALCKKENAHLV